MREETTERMRKWRKGGRVRGREGSKVEGRERGRDYEKKNETDRNKWTEASILVN